MNLSSFISPIFLLSFFHTPSVYLSFPLSLLPSLSLSLSLSLPLLVILFLPSSPVCQLCLGWHEVDTGVYTKLLSASGLRSQCSQSLCVCVCVCVREIEYGIVPVGAF